MNIISNDCVGGRIYNELNLQYNNPFIWTCLTTNDFIYLINNYNNIDFSKYSCILSNYSFNGNKNYPIIIVDNKITLHYVHYKYDMTYKEITKTSNYKYSLDISYCDILNYTENVYKRRIKRMTNEMPIFIYNPSIQQFINNSSKNVLTNKDIYKLIVCTNNNDLLQYSTDTHKLYMYNYEYNKKFELTQNIAKNIIKQKLI